MPHHVVSEKLVTVCMGLYITILKNGIVFGKATVTVLARFHSKSAFQCCLHRNSGINSVFHGISMAEWFVN